MKRNLSSRDEAVIQSQESVSSEGEKSEIDVSALKDSFEKINNIDAGIDRLLLKRKRFELSVNMEPAVKQKIFRVFLRPEFHPACQKEKAHYIIHVEGMVLDPMYMNSGYRFGQFFDRVVVQLDRKYSQQQHIYEWKEDDYPAGRAADSIRIKVNYDKPVMSRIYLHRTDEVCLRYNISDQLRALLPNLNIDTTQEEILLAFWMHLEQNGYFCTEKDRKKFINLDETLQRLLQTDGSLLPVSALRMCLAKHMVPCQPIVAELYLSHAHTAETFAASIANNYSMQGGGRWPAGIAYTRAGGRVFEIEVDVRDPAALKGLRVVNAMAETEYTVGNRVRQLQEELALIANRVVSLQKDRETYSQILRDINIIGAGDHAPSVVDASTHQDDALESSSASSSASGSTGVSALQKACRLSIYDRITHRKVVDNYTISCKYPEYFESEYSWQLQEEEEEEGTAYQHTTGPSDAFGGAINTSSTIESKEASDKDQSNQVLQFQELPPSKPPLAIEATAPCAPQPTPLPPLSFLSSGETNENSLHHPSSLHSFSGYLDTGDSALFDSSSGRYSNRAKYIKRTKYVDNTQMTRSAGISAAIASTAKKIPRIPKGAVDTAAEEFEDSNSSNKNNHWVHAACDLYIAQQQQQKEQENTTKLASSMIMKAEKLETTGEDMKTN